MAENTNGKHDDLRRRAEELLASTAGDSRNLNPKQAREILLDLQVHRLELELQNDELRRTRGELEDVHLRFARLYHNAPVGYVVLDRAGIIKQANATFARLVKADAKAIDGAPFASFLARDDESVFRARYKTFFRNPIDKYMEVRFETSGGASFHAHLEAAPHHHDRSAGQIEEYDELLVTIADITKRKSAEQKIEHLNRILLAIRNVNQLITHETDAGHLLGEACRMLTETRGFYNAWIALLDEGGTSVTAVSSAGVGEPFDLIRRDLECGAFPACMKQALENDSLIVIKDPPSQCPDCPLARGYAGRAGITSRLAFEGRDYGTLSVSAPLEYAYDTEEHDLLREVADDIAFALRKIETEKQLHRLNHIVKTVPQPMALVSSDYRYLAVNDVYARLFDTPRE
ncbi:MAG: PAS domain S-box protein, partial [Chitinivibrionales bacterium]|nr:PAS domain S-box protein [Chitinivibrionales bacterium]MBD3357899.1 PAS domain S-box protein [Chitinivibrionales bacterium]